MSYIVTVDYTMKQRAISDGIRLNDTTLDSTIEEARRYSNFFLVLNKRKKAFEDERLMWKEKGLDKFNVQTEVIEAKDEIILNENEEAVESIMSGNIWKIEVQVGDEVKAGEVLVILESMKMEVDIEATISGTISQILFKEGDNIESGNVLVVIKKDER